MNPLFKKHVVEVYEHRRRVFCRDDAASADTNACNRAGNDLGANKTINRINDWPNLIKEWLVHPRESRCHFFAELYRRVLIYQRRDKIRRAARRELG